MELPALCRSVSRFVFLFWENRGTPRCTASFSANGSIHAVAENALDVPHTAYLHGGLFRTSSGKPREIEVVVSRYADRVEAEYIGESRPSGLTGRLLAPGGGIVTHVDRFILPSITQVDLQDRKQNPFMRYSCSYSGKRFCHKAFCLREFPATNPGVGCCSNSSSSLPPNFSTGCRNSQAAD